MQGGSEELGGVLDRWAAVERQEVNRDGCWRVEVCYAFDDGVVKWCGGRILKMGEVKEESVFTGCVDDAGLGKRGIARFIPGNEFSDNGSLDGVSLDVG